MQYLILAGVFLSCSEPPVQSVDSDDGYRAWLRYEQVSDNKLRSMYTRKLSSISIQGNSTTLSAIHQELATAIPALIGKEISLQPNKPTQANVLISTPEHTEIIAKSGLLPALKTIGEEGFIIKDTGEQIVVTANKDIGLLYGTFELLRQIQTYQSLDNIHIVSTPRVEFRMVNHWDNLSRLVERGYAGLSIWEWGTLPEYKHPRYTDYARLNASVGINAIAVNNVNADPRILNDEFIQKLTTLADLFRPYGIKLFVSINFQSPMHIGGLSTADPLNEQVRSWWAEKADQIYDVIPDFGGFLIKADSEGQPGPFLYNRNHAEGANMLAEALEPHNGIVIWRAFVYSPEQSDRFREAYDEFKPLDGAFKKNVILQVKNGPIDFQPREPISPLFGALKHTNTMLELQITQEYFGFSNHLAYQGTLFEEVLDTDTFANGVGSTVSEVIAGNVHKYEHTGMAAVINVGTDRNWTGHPFIQSSWYAFGRFSWDSSLSAKEIAQEWVKMTFSNLVEVVDPVVEIMMISREAGVNYRMPLGLTHLYAQGHHYGPAPWTAHLDRPDWNAVYYHRADEKGIGFDRTETGSNAIEQYQDPNRKIFQQVETTPEPLLLWFHRLSWDYEMKSGRTLWEELVYSYYLGVDQVKHMQTAWQSLEGLIDPHRFEQVNALLSIQLKDAIRWRDSCILYFQQFSGMEIPSNYEQPEFDLNHYMSLEQSLYVPDPRYN